MPVHTEHNSTVIVAYSYCIIYSIPRPIGRVDLTDKNLLEVCIGKATYRVTCLACLNWELFCKLQ